MVDSLKIALDNQRRWVYPGGILSGTVIIQVSEPVKARAVEIRFEGKASCGWTEYEYRPSVYYDGRYRSRHRWVNYDAEIVYANHEQVVWGPPSGQGVLQPGTHQCRFQFQVPQNAGPTFEGRHGHIRYHLKAKIDRPWRVDDTCFLPLTVMPYFDLNALPYAGHPLLREIHRDLRCCCLSYGRMLVRLFVNKSGFVPGEAIPIRMEIENSSDKGTHNFQATLFQIQHFTGQDCGRHKMNSHKAQIAGLRKQFVPLKFGNFIHEEFFQIPSCVPSFNYCPIMQVEYTLMIRIEADVMMDCDMMCEVPILIGSVPVRRPVEVPRAQIHTENKLVPPEPSAPPKDFTPQVSPAKISADPKQDYKDGKVPPYNPEYCYYPELNAPTKC